GSEVTVDHPSAPHLIHTLSTLSTLSTPHFSLLQIHQEAPSTRKQEFTNPAKFSTGLRGMATASATSAQAVFTCSTVRSSCSRSTTTKVNYISGINSFGGLKAQNQISCLGLPLCTEKAFAKVMNSTRASSQRTCRGGGALSSTCNAVGEIFRIAAIMNGLVLIGVAVGFVLLRVEASVEEE
ncbi:Cytochrome b6-f complex subunit 7, partial [Nymphaea thermarum]